jgi:hypothetical protein
VTFSFESPESFLSAHCRKPYLLWLCLWQTVLLFIAILLLFLTNKHKQLVVRITSISKVKLFCISCMPSSVLLIQEVYLLRNLRYNYIGWSKSHATHIKICIDGCNSIQFDGISKHTISLWLYKSPRRSRHVITCSRQSVNCLQTVEVQGCLFHKCNECSLSNTAWHLVLT